jgi:putative ABC transport system ATP-binding protein
LSTIKRSDRIICIGPDGQVAEEGTYRELASNPDGAFSKLMEWQLNGGEAENRQTDFPKPTEEEEIEVDLEEDDGENPEEDKGQDTEKRAVKKDGSRVMEPTPSNTGPRR